MPGAPIPENISTQLHDIAEKAASYPEMSFNNISHKIDMNLLREAYRQTRKDGASGVDGVTAEEYAADLGENLKNLHERLKTGRYKAPPVRRAWINKEGGEQRPIGIPVFEDKIVQRAVVTVLNPIYESDFHPFSYGFRPGRSQHQALHDLRECCQKMNIGWIADADVSDYFENIDHDILRELINRRVCDKGINRLIGKWLNAGVTEAGNLFYPERGTPQGGVISPLLSNIYLHYILDEWYVKDVKPRMHGRSFLIRYADDFIVGFEYESDALRFTEVLPKRLNRFGLTVNTEKTSLVNFGRRAVGNRVNRGESTFDFLGFTHYRGKTRNGYYVIKRKTAKKRLSRFMKRLWLWCRDNRHMTLKEQYKILCAKLRGFYQYYGVRCNYEALAKVYDFASRAWRYWLSRRCHKGKVIWENFVATLKRMFPFPKPRIVHNI